jgi:hypothetical protein
VSMTDDLAGLLSRETQALEAMRINDAVALRDDKARLTRRYRAAIEELRAGRVSLREITQEERRRLSEAATRLGRVVTDNERALRAGRAAVERVVAAIARAVNAKERRSIAYAPPRHAPARQSRVGGIAFDRRL